MIQAIIPRIPCRNLEETEQFFQQNLDFRTIGKYPDYLLLENNGVEVHFFLDANLEVESNPFSVYVRLGGNIEALFQRVVANGVTIPAAGRLSTKPWGMLEFALIDPNHNLFTFGQAV